MLSTLETAEQDFFTRLYGTYREPMWRYVCAIICGQKAEMDADDVVHDAFVSLLGKVDLLRSLEKIPLDAYVTITVKRMALRHLHQKIADPLSELEDIRDTNEGPDDIFIKMADIAQIGQAMRTLPEIQKDALALRYMNGNNYGDIGNVLGISEGNARVICHRALQRLKIILAEETV